jgi:hypothetical protein
MAEGAASQLYKALVVKGHAININWAKPRAQAYVEGHSSSSSSSSSSGGVAMLPPPGMESAPASTYALPGLPQPVLLAQSCSSSSSGGYFVGGNSAPGGAGGGVGGGGGVGMKRGAGEMGGEGVPVPQKKAAAGANQYPSMNPARMGAKI